MKSKAGNWRSGSSRWPHPGEQGGNMADILFIGGTLVFFGLTWLFVALCERV
jgi:hypothetical protein